MRKIFVILIFSVPVISSAQDKIDTLGWHKSGFIGINFSQAAFSNWAAGGDNSIAGTGVFGYLLKFRRNKNYWNNSLDLAFGMLKTEDQGIRKSDDKISLGSDYGRFAFGKFYYSGQFNFITQFAPGYNYPNDSVVVSRFMSPAYSTLALGLNWKPNDYFSLFFSPITGKFTFVLDQTLADKGAFGVDSAIYNSAGVKIKKGQNIRSEFGASVNALLQKEIFKNIVFASKLQLFTNYTDKVSRGNIDVNWENGLVMVINEYFNAAVSAQIIYDDDIPVPLYKNINGVKTQTGTGPRTQVKESLSIGFGYKF